MKIKTKDYELLALNDLTDAFTDEMKERVEFLYQKGVSGWDDPDDKYDYMGRINYHLERGHLIDAANLIMFLWNKKEYK